MKVLLTILLVIILEVAGLVLYVNWAINQQIKVQGVSNAN